MRAFSYAWSLPVTWQTWQSHHSICHIPKPHAIHANFVHGSMFYRTSVTGNRNFTPREQEFLNFLALVSLTLIPLITCIYELDPYPLEIYHMCENELFLLQGFRKLSYYSILTDMNTYTDKQTDIRHRNYIQRRFAGGQKQNAVISFCQSTRFFISMSTVVCY